MPCAEPHPYATKCTISKRSGWVNQDAYALGIARETLHQLGLGTNSNDAERLGLSGKDGMPGSEVYDFTEAADGFAKVFPQHKYNVVEILQQRGYLVVMTGEGVNDAPSSEYANTAIVVEESFDAARSAANTVFLAPAHSAIMTPLRRPARSCGRIFKNTQRRNKRY